jgi:hypothetical protein
MDSADQSLTHASSETPVSREDEVPPEQPMLFCPNCDERLISRRCKLLCEHCGYFMSCADYY